MKKTQLFITTMVTIFLLGLIQFAVAQNPQKWCIVLGPELQQDEAIRVAIEDITETGTLYNLAFRVVGDNTLPNCPSIFVGSPKNNRQTAHLQKKLNIQFANVDHEQGYQIITKTLNGKRVVIIYGGSVLGEVYGLYWLWDRLRVYKEIPVFNEIRKPAVGVRHPPQAKGIVKSKEGLKRALRYSENWITVDNPLSLIPWEAEPEASENKKNREKTRELIKYAHDLHLKYFVYSDEFTYHPSLIEKSGATLSLEDPLFWEAVQEKYRKLFRSLPEIDGIGVRTGESTQVWGNYRAFDVMHKDKASEWPLDKRYRTLVNKIYDVVVKEFGKLYYQRTWVTSMHEQHSHPEVYKEIFTKDIPTKDLYVVPKITTTDCWYFQPYNRTFNQTPHHTILEFERMSHFNNNIFPSFPGQYFQSGIQTVLLDKKTNLRGFGFDIPFKEGWKTGNVTAYVLYRLAWNPNEDMRTIARDFCAIHFGRQAADIMADIYLLSPTAFKYGLYIEPVAYGQFNSMPHLRGSIFPAKGFPLIDKGKKHMQFLETMYLRCRPWQKETLMYLDNGLAAADSMLQKYQSAKPLLKNPQLAKDVENSLRLLLQFIKSNNLYVKTAFSYFDYMNNPNSENKNNLDQMSNRLTTTMQEFRQTPGFSHKLYGMETLQLCVQSALKDIDSAKQVLTNAPDDDQLGQLISHQQSTLQRILKEHEHKAVKLLHWEGRVDGKDVLNIKDRDLSVKHVQFSPINNMSFEFFANLPKAPAIVIPKDMESRSFHPFVLEQPCQANDYTAKIYLSDFPEHGYSWWKFDLYYIPISPEELGVPVFIGGR